VDWRIPYPSIRQPILAANCVSTNQPLAAQAGLAMLAQGRQCSRGVVTRTKFGPREDWKSQPRSGCGGSLPRPESFFSEDAERAAGCEMALDVESVLDDGVNGQEALS
jgi:hypothetical protein